MYIYIHIYIYIYIHMYMYIYGTSSLTHGGRSSAHTLTHCVKCVKKLFSSTTDLKVGKNTNWLGIQLEQDGR